MLDTSYYEKTDQIIAQYSCEEKSLTPYYPRGSRRNIVICRRSF